MMTPKRALKRSRSITPGRALKRRNAMRTTSVPPAAQTTAVSIPPSMSRALPKNITVKLRYYNNHTLNPLGGAAAAVLYRANSAYDPEFSVGGGQPMGLDQWFSLYTKAVVVGSKCTAKTVNSTGGEQALFGVTLCNASAAELTCKPYIEQDRTSWSLICGPTSVDTEVTAKYGAKSFFSLKDIIEADDQTFTNGSDASAGAYFHVWLGSVSGTHDPAQHIVQVLVEYTITFYEPRQLPVS